jgi:hypothetical protein
MEGVWTSDDAVSLDDIPKDILIIGGGVIGLEFACAYAAFGSKVTVVELMEQVLPGNDKRVVKATQSALEEMGVEFLLGDAVESVERVGERMRSTLRSGAVVESGIVMSAVGRVPNGAGFGFEEAGIEMDRRAVKVDEHLRTNIAGVYAIGDLIGGMMLAHVADEEGIVAARNAVAEITGEGHAETLRYDCIPACVYTFPNVAVVGSSRDSAKDRRSACGRDDSRGCACDEARHHRASGRRDGPCASDRLRGHQDGVCRRCWKVRLLAHGVRARTDRQAHARVDEAPHRTRGELRLGQAAHGPAQSPHRLSVGEMPQPGRVFRLGHSHVPHHGRCVYSRVSLLRGRHPRASPARSR